MCEREVCALALVSEVDARDRASQEQAWRDLDDGTRAFQLCLRLLQERVPTNPQAGAAHLGHVLGAPIG